jgi:hypothetical protein
MLTPFPLSLLSRFNSNEYKKTNIMPEPQQHVSTVTIPLSEYNEMNKSLELLNKALEDNKIVIRDTDNHWSFTKYHTLTRDEALTKIAEKYYKLDNKYQDLKEQNTRICNEFSDYTEASLWTRIMRVFNKQY